MGQTERLKKRASQNDRRRLEEYFESIRVAEKELAQARAWMDRPKPKVEADKPSDIFNREDLVGRTKLLMNLVPLIVQTDSSRVISIVIQDHQVVPSIDGVEMEHHNLSHHGQDPAKIKQLKTIEKQLLGCFGDLVGAMKSKEEGQGTLLDNTSILFGSNLGNANSHDPRNLPIFLAGGDYDHGKYVAYDKSNNKPLCNLFVNMLNQLGVQTERFATSSGTLDWE